MAAFYHATPTEILERFSSPELSEMIAFDNLYGLPDAYFIVAQLAAATLAPWAKEPVKAGAFVPFFRERQPREKQTTKDHMRILRAFSGRV